MNNEIEKQLDSLPVATPVALKEEQSEVDFGTCLKEAMIKNLYNSWADKASYQNKVFRLEFDEFKKYCSTLLALRIDSIKHENGYKKKFLHTRIRVPALIALTLSSIGFVHQKNLGLTLYPVHAVPDDEKLTDEELEQVSNKLGHLEDLGFVMVDGLPKDRMGNSHFMFFNKTNNVITRHDDLAPSSLAVLTSFFDTLQLKATLSQRVDYGTVETYDNLLAGLIYDSAR